jgi:hypothetical protein
MLSLAPHIYGLLVPLQNVHFLHESTKKSKNCST